MSPKNAHPTAPSERIKSIFLILRKKKPEPTTELVYHDPFSLLVAVSLSAQSTDKAVNQVTPQLFQMGKTPEDMLALGQSKIESLIARLGLFRNKARHLIACSKHLIEKHHSQVPRTREELEALPGVGRKTASVLLNTLYSEPTIAVDTHVFRVSHRLALSKGKNPLQVEQDLEHIVPEEFKHNAHHWLILLGRYTCLARNPKCDVCPVGHLCPSRQA